MSKQNTALLLNRYIWLLDALYTAGSLSREEIDRRWSRSSLNDDGSTIPERTFHRYKDAIQELFQINIAFSKSRGYYIENSTDIKHHELRKWLVSTFAVNNLINESELRKHIDFETMPSGQHYLTTILEAIRDKVRLRVTHQGFCKSEASEFTIAPYCLKVFKQRWYVLAESKHDDKQLRVYSLDRFIKMERTNEKYVIPKKFDMHDHFFSYYGVTSGDKTQKEVVRLRANALQSKFLRTLPLHPTQQEVESTEEYTIFEYYIIPTLEFRKELLSCGSAIEVLAPQSLREEMKKQIQEMMSMYNY